MNGAGPTKGGRGRVGRSLVCDPATVGSPSPLNLREALERDVADLCFLQRLLDRLGDGYCAAFAAREHVAAVPAFRREARPPQSAPGTPLRSRRREDYLFAQAVVNRPCTPITAKP